MECPNCSSEIRATASVCPDCGDELPRAQARPRAAQAKHGTSNHNVAVAAAALLLLVFVVGGFFAVRALTDPAVESEEVPEVTSAAAGDGAMTAASSHATAEEAIAARLAEEGLSDWVFEVSEEGDGYVVYIAGPPASEFASQYRVEEGPGGWTVVQSVALGFEDVEVGSSDEAEQIVLQYLTFVAQDKGADAQSLTVDPLRADPASAQVSEGGLAEYSIVGSLGDPDGSYWIQTTQVWFGSPENWEYWVVPTDTGYRISDVQPW